MGADSADCGFESKKILDRGQIYDCRFCRQQRLGDGLGGVPVKMGADSADWGLEAKKSWIGVEFMTADSADSGGWEVGLETCM